jgi:hypothetical protein
MALSLRISKEGWWRVIEGYGAREEGLANPACLALA